MKFSLWQTVVISAVAISTAVAALIVTAAAVASADTLGLEEEAAFRRAVDRVAPAVVRIEPAGLSEAGIGGAAEAAPATGASSGLVVDPAGWVVTTAFAVPTDATQAIVMLPDGTRQAARAVGRDLARGLVLLKIELAPGISLPVAETAPRSELAVGQWTLAVGRAWSTTAPSVAIGILSAKNRAWGRAVQTDASVSPANYGGPLVDIEGRVIGILAPLPADTAGMMAGTELYDSGIGFAVPIADISSVLPRLMNGETLRPGILGIGYSSRDPFTAPANIATCRVGSPAAKAGLRPGDTVVTAAGQPVTRIAELRHVLAPRYAGDTVELVVDRPQKAGGSVRVSARATLVAELPPWRRPMLGIVPDRSAGVEKADGKEKSGGVRVQWLWPEGPAARAGVRAGDVVESIIEATGNDQSGARSAAGCVACRAGRVCGRHRSWTDGPALDSPWRENPADRDRHCGAGGGSAAKRADGCGHRPRGAARGPRGREAAAGGDARRRCPDTARRAHLFWPASRNRRQGRCQRGVGGAMAGCGRPA
jgi:serine protease Do